MKHQPRRTPTGAELLGHHYPRWTASFSNEQFDRAQGLAFKLTDADRKAGRPAPAYGYSIANFELADALVSAANAYSACQQDGSIWRGRR